MNGKRRKKRQEEAMKDIALSLIFNLINISRFIFVLYLLNYHQKLENFWDYFFYAVGINIACDVFLSKSDEQKKEE